MFLNYDNALYAKVLKKRLANTSLIPVSQKLKQMLEPFLDSVNFRRVPAGELQIPSWNEKF